MKRILKYASLFFMLLMGTRTFAQQLFGIDQEVAKTLSAATYSDAQKSVMFFSGNNMFYYPLGSKQPVIPKWSTIEGIKTVDAAVPLDADRTLLFDGSSFRVFRHSTASFVTELTQWPGLPGAWNNQLDGAVQWDDDLIFLLFNDEYVTYSISSDTLTGPEKMTGWKGWPAGWANGVDDAFNPGDGFIYFIRAGEIIAFSMEDQKFTPVQKIVAANSPTVSGNQMEADAAGGSGTARLENPLEVAGAVQLINRWKNQNLALINGKPGITDSPDTWFIEQVGNDDFVRLKNTSTGTYLHNQKGPLEAGAIQPGWWSAQWTMKEVDGHFQLINRWMGTYLNNEKGPLELSALGAPGWFSAQWKSVATVPTVGKVTFVNAMKTAPIIDIFKENGTQTPEFVNRLVGTASYTVKNARVGDVFSFEAVNDFSLKIPTYTMVSIGETHALEAGTRYGNGKGQQVNTKASEHSFDIFKIDPIYIAYTGEEDIISPDGRRLGNGGMRKQIFESLKVNDMDWKPTSGENGDVALKNQFTMNKLDEGKDFSETETSYTEESFRRSYTANLSFSGGTPDGSVQGSQGASMTYSTANTKGDRNIYTYSRSSHTIYSIALNKDEIALTEDFKAAIKALPETRDPSAYESFITVWGTHYPTKVNYGGLMVGVLAVDEKTYMESEGWGIQLNQGVKAKVVGTERGFGMNEEKAFNKLSSKSKSFYYYKGGSGGSGGLGPSWNVNQGSAQPFGAELSRLHELLQGRFFDNGLTDSQLDKRKQLLASAITTYIGSATDAGRSLKPRVFKMSNVRWKMIEEKDGAFSTPRIFGNIAIGMRSYAIELSKMPGNLFAFRRIDDDNAISAPKGFEWVSDDDVKIVFMTPKSSRDLSESCFFRILVNLWDSDKGLSDPDKIGQTVTEIRLTDIGNRKRTITVPLRSDSGDIDVMYDVEEIELR